MLTSASSCVALGVFGRMSAITKICSTCKRELPETDFRWKVKNIGLRASQCRGCMSEYGLKQRTPSKTKANNEAWKKDRIAKVLSRGVTDLPVKTCRGCNLTLPSSSFRWQSKALMLRYGRCKSCDAQHRAEVYRLDLAISRQWKKSASQTHARLREIIVQEKAKPCADCGSIYPHYVMDFDHLEPSKKLSKVSAMVYFKSEALLREEISKCEVVCANCHRIRTFQRRSRTTRPKRLAC